MLQDSSLHGPHAVNVSSSGFATKHSENGGLAGELGLGWGSGLM